MTPGKSKLQTAHEYLLSKQDVDIEKDYAEFEQSLKDNPDYFKSVYSYLQEDPDVSVSQKTFEDFQEAMLPKKKVDTIEPSAPSKKSSITSIVGLPEDNTIRQDVTDPINQLSQKQIIGSLDEETKSRLVDAKLRKDLGIDAPDEPDSTDKIGTFAGSFNQAFVDVVASAPKTFALVVKGIHELTSLGNSRPLQDYDAYKFGDWIDESAKDIGITATDPSVQGFALRGAPNAIGTAMAFMLTGKVSPAANAIKAEGSIAPALKEFAKQATSRPAMAGAMTMGVYEFENAKRAGASDSEAIKAFVENAIVSTTEAVPLMRMLDRVNEYSGGGVSRFIKAGLKGGLDEGVQEAVQQTLTNQIAAGTYDPKRQAFDGLLESAGTGFFVGFILPGIMGAMSKMTPEQQTETKAIVNNLLKSQPSAGPNAKPIAEEQPAVEQTGPTTPSGDLGKSTQEPSPIIEEPAVQENIPQEKVPVETPGAEQPTPVEPAPSKELTNKEYESELEKRLPESLSPEEKQGSIRGGEVNAEATIITGAIHRSVRKAKGSGKKLSQERLKKEEESNLENYAKEKGVWIKDEFGKPDTNGFEQDVYLNPETQTVTKVNSGITHEDWDGFFKRVAVHNTLFPDVPYTVKGFTNHKGDFSVVIEQPLVTGKEASFSEVKEEMEKLGFTQVEQVSDDNEKKQTFVNNEGVIVSDLHGENVIKSENGRLHFIDPQIEFTQERKNKDESGPELSDEVQRDTAINPSEGEVNQPPVEEKSSDTGPVEQNNTGASVEFEWLGENRTGTIISTDPVTGRVKVKSNGVVYPIEPKGLKQVMSAPSPTIQQSSKTVIEDLEKMTKTYKKKSDPEKPKGGIVPITINPLTLIKKAWIGFNKAQHLLTDKIVKTTDHWIAKKVGKGLEHNNMALRNATGVAQNLIGGLAYTPGDLTNKLNFTGNKNFGHLKARMLSQDMYAMIDSDPQSLENVHRALDPETWVAQTQQGQVLTSERDALKRSLAGHKGRLTTLNKAANPDIVEIDKTQNAIADTNDLIDQKEVELQRFQKDLGDRTRDGLNEQEKNLFDLVRSTNDFIHEWYHDNGLISDETYAEHKGTYIARLYEEFELTPPDVNETFKSSRPDFNIFKQRKDFGDVSQTLIRDPVFATSKRLAQMLQTQAIFDYAADLVASPSVTVSDTEFPNSTQLGQPDGKKYYGAITGKFVPNYIAQDFKGFFFANQMTQHLYEGLRGYDKLVARQFLKKLHTVYNPLVQIGNKISNYSFSAWAGVDAYTFTVNKFRAAKEIKEKGQYYQDLVKAGILGTDIVTTDLKPVATTVEEENSTLGKLSDKATEAYGMADDEAKLSTYISLIEDYKYSKEEAAQRVYNSFQNYATVGKLYDFAAKTPVIGNPYIKFKADLARIIKNGVVNQPLTMAAYMGMLVLIKNLLSDASGEDEVTRKIRERRPFTPKVNTPFGDVSMLWQVPGVGEVNMARFVSPYYVYDKGNNDDMVNEISEWLPYQFEQAELSASKENKIPIPELNDVFLGVYAQVLFDRDFRGKSIRDPEGTKYLTRESDYDQQILNGLSYISRSQLPFWGSASDMLKAYNGEADYFGRERTLSQALLNNVIKVQEFGSKQAQETLTKEIKYKVSKFESLSRDVSALKGDAKRHLLKIANSSMPEDRKKLATEKEVEHLKKAILNKIEQQVEIVKSIEDPAKLLKELENIKKE